MKIIRSSMLILLVLSMCFMLAACSLSEEDVIGEWMGTYTYDGNLFNVSFSVNADGTYEKIIIKNGDVHKVEEGTYYIEGNELNLESNDKSSSTPYKYKSGVLVNNGHEFRKIS